MVFQAGRDLYVSVSESAHSTAVVTQVPALPDLVPQLFVGRGHERDQLRELLTPATTSPVVVSVVSGLGGVGKTALARLAAAEAVQRGSFPGGAVFVDMHGYDPNRCVRAPQAFGPLLRALGLPATEVPARLDEQASCYHRLLAQKAQEAQPVLLVLDNVSSGRQIADLLPVSGKHRVLVTSRNLLAQRLPAGRSIVLPVLPPEHAAQLLRESMTLRCPGDERPTDTGSGITELAELCGHLPLALEIVAALLAEDASLGIAALRTELADSHTRLATLDDGERAVKAAFDLSYQRLDEEQARLFVLLSLNPGPEMAVEAAAVLYDRPESATRRALTELARAHLIQQGSEPGRWSMHDLLRLYSTEMLARSTSDERRTAALGRVLRHYADRVRSEERHFYPPQQTGVPQGDEWLGRRNQAIAWFDRELPNILGTVDRAAATGFADISVRTAVHLFHYLDHYRLWPEWEATHRTALEAASATGDEVAEARLLCSLGLLLREQHRLEEAHVAQARSLELARRTGDAVREGWAGVHLGGVLCDEHRHEEAVTVLRGAVPVFQGVPDAHGEAWAHQNLGAVHAAMGQLDKAVAAYEESIRVRSAAADTYGGVFTWTKLGAVHAKAGNHVEAARCLERSMALSRHLGYADELALAQGLAASVCSLRGQTERAEQHREATLTAVRSFSALDKSVLALLELGDEQSDIGDEEGAAHTYRAALDLLGIAADSTRRLKEQVAEVARQFHR